MKATTVALILALALGTLVAIQPQAQAAPETPAWADNAPGPYNPNAPQGPVPARSGDA